MGSGRAIGWCDGEGLDEGLLMLAQNLKKRGRAQGVARRHVNYGDEYITWRSSLRFMRRSMDQYFVLFTIFVCIFT